jgi:hypothetical protein
LDALKTGQLHRLSLDLISPEAIKEIFNATVYRAAQNQMTLLINHPLGLFQVKASYYVKPDSIKLFIHMLMAPTNSLLHLLKFHPFTLPFTDTQYSRTWTIPFFPFPVDHRPDCMLRLALPH